MHTSNTNAIPKPRTKKYRPVLTAAQVKHILTLAKTAEATISDDSLSLISSLSPFLAKIENEALVPAYTSTATTTKKSLASMTNEEILEALAPALSKEEVWELAYTKCQEAPLSCSLQEIKEATEHMYLNDLLSEQEIGNFENGIYFLPTALAAPAPALAEPTEPAPRRTNHYKENQQKLREE